MKIHLKTYPTEQNGFVPVSLEIEAFKYPYNPLEDRYEYGYFSNEEIAKKHRKIIEYIEGQLKAQLQMSEPANNNVELSEDLKQANQEIKRFIYKNCPSWPLAPENIKPFKRPAADNEFYTSNGVTLKISLLAPINSTIGQLNNLLGEYAITENKWQDIDPNIGLLAVDSVLEKSYQAESNARSCVEDAARQMKFLQGPDRYSVSDKKTKDEFLENLNEKYNTINKFVEIGKQTVSIIERIANQITNTNNGPQNWQLAKNNLLRSNRQLKYILAFVNDMNDIIKKSNLLIDKLLNELSSDPIKQEQVNKWLLQKRLEARKSAIYSRLDRSNWINLDEKSLSEIEEMIVEFNVIKQDMTELNITGHWISTHKLFIEALARKKIEKINKELVFFEQIDFSQKNVVELVELSAKFAYLVHRLQNNNTAGLHTRITKVEEKINQRDVALQVAANKIEQFSKKLEFFEQIDFAEMNADELSDIHADFAYLISNNDQAFRNYDRIQKIRDRIKQRDATLQSEISPSPVENNNIDSGFSGSKLGSNQNIKDNETLESSNRGQQGLLTRAMNAARQIIVVIFSSIKFILSYPLRWIYGEPQQSKQQPNNKPPVTVQPRPKKYVKPITKIQSATTFTPLMLAKAQRELARESTIATDSRNPIIGLQHNLERLTNNSLS